MEALTPLKRALHAIETLQDRVRSLEAKRDQPIAIVGSGCRFPGGGNDPDSYYAALLAGRDAIQPRPLVARPGWPESDDLPPAGYLDIDAGGFDAAFFGISPREAASIDPQHRLALECSWEALESAAINPRALEGSRTGVFLGMAANDYAQMQLRSQRVAQLLNSHFASGIGHSMASGRVSYLLGLQGPAITVDTACSSSLVAVHLACQSLRTRESDLALAIGVNLILAPDYTVAFQQSRMLSSDGRCRTFDADADGFSRAEGCGAIVLKRLDDAERDGDRILAVIRATAVNQDGPSSGLTAPNGPAQSAVMRAALRSAGLKPSDIGYIEAHGTGTSLGDPIEVQALGEVFNDRQGAAPLLVGSVKTNLGHLEAAAGIAGLIKLVESIRHGVIPAHLHLRTPSPHIPWNELNIAVPTTSVPFPVTGGRRRGGVSSFGFSGTNAHVIVEEAPAREIASVADIGGVLTLSGSDEQSLRAVVERYASELESSTDRFTDICFTANVGRAQLAHRLALVAEDRGTAARLLGGWLRGETDGALRTTHLRSMDRPGLAFLFTGQGAQYVGMGWALREQSATIREALSLCSEILHGELEVPLLDVLDPASPHAELVNRTDYTQPALFALQYALGEMWRRRGIEPTVVAGHSIGEFAAAHYAGVFSLEDALRLVAVRGRLMHAVRTAGSMEAIFSTEERVREWVEAVGGEVSVAGVNATDQIVVSGTVDAVRAVTALAAAAGVSTRALRTSHAFHSPLMDEVATSFRDAAAAASMQPARRVRFVSTMTGEVVSPERLADADYWAQQLRRPVQFARAARTVASLASVAVEIGPHPALSALVRQNDLDLAVVPSLERDKPQGPVLLAAHRDLHLAGLSPDWSAAAADSGSSPRRVALPIYPFQRTSLWVDLGAGTAGGITDGHPLIGRQIAQPGAARTFERTLSAEAPAFIGDHVVLGRTILPGTAYVEMALAAGAQLSAAGVELRDLDLVEPMLFADGELRRVHCRFEPGTDSEWRVSIHSTAEPAGPDATWTLHASGHLTPAALLPASVDVAAVSARCERVVGEDEFHTSLRSRGYAFGPRLHGVREVRVGTDEVLAAVALPECAQDGGRYIAHPLILDAGLQSISCALPADAGRAYVPMSISRVAVGGDLTAVSAVHARITDQRAGIIVADAVFISATGAVVAAIEGVSFRQTQVLSAPDDEFLEIRWVDAGADRGAAVIASGARAHHVLRSGLAGSADQHDAAAYDAFIDSLEVESALWVCRAMHDLGWEPRPGEIVQPNDLAASLRVAPGSFRLFARMLDIFAEQGLLVRHGPDWQVREVLPLPDALPELRVGDAAPEHVLLRRCGPALAASLRGAIDPLELLFPGGDGALAEMMYYDAPIARIMNAAITDVLAEALASLEPGRVLRVLEVGGGTAGTTRRIVERFHGNGTEPRMHYTFTDVSPMFVERARRRFHGMRGFEFRTLDLDRAPEQQGCELGSYDVVIGANCLHASKDLAAAMHGVRQLLRPGGMLLAAEVFAPHRWFDLTVGLTDGWWHFTDTALRPDYACVAPAVWERVLRQAGFDEIAAVPLADAAGTSGHASRHQGVIVSFRAAEPSDSAGEAWLLIGDEDQTSREMVQHLTHGGHHVMKLSAADIVHHADPTGVVAGALGSRSRWSGVVHCVLENTLQNSESVPTALRVHSGSLLAAAQAVAAAHVDVGRLCVITRNAQYTSDSDAEVNAAQAASWGLLRAVSQELPGVSCRALDMDDAPVSAHAVRWLRQDDGEPEAAYRHGSVRVPRLRRRTSEHAALPAEYRLAPARRGSIDHLEFSTGERRAPAEREVEIRVAATALNFKDVLNVLGMYPGEPGPLGSECSGVVTRIGVGVTHVSPGDEVIASAGGAYGMHVLADASLVARKPPRLDFAAAATIPVAYLTAHFALNHLARMQASDRVLIHAAAGGVGLAACHLAMRAGARILATAGSDEKRRMLRELGIAHVFDSRSLSFADDVMAATGGAGATIVLNSLADDFVERSFAVTARGGRFLEIGKRGIWSPEQVAALGRDLSYHVIDWGVTAREQPDLMGRLLSEITDAVSSGEIPPLPRTEFELAQVRDAFRYMAQAKHTGKIVLRHPVQRPLAPIEFRSDASYLITGGTAGLGLATAEWAVAHGAGTLVLASRRAPDADATEAIERMRQQGVRVLVWQMDVGDRTQVDEVFARMRAELPPLRGVIHAAGALADRTLQHISWQDFEEVLRAKAYGTVLLGEAARSDSPDFIVAYSSIASVFGSPGQANHSAANAFMDAFVARSWRTDVAGMSIAWGPWAETGAAVRSDVLERSRQRGLEPFTTAVGLEWISRAFERPASLLVGARITRPDALGGMRNRRFVQDLVPSATIRAAASVTTPEPHAEKRPFAEELATLPAGARRAVVVNRVRTRVRAVLGLSADAALDADRPLGELGLDSLLAIELRNVLGEDAGRRLPATLLFDHPTSGALADALLSMMDLHEDSGMPTPAAVVHDPLTAVHAMSDDDVDRLLAEKLKQS